MTGLPADTRFSVVDDGSGHGTLITENPVVTITVFASDGLDFQHDPNPITEMGTGTIQPGASNSTFTIVDAASSNKFVFDGSDFTYDITGVTGGTITAIHEFAANGSPIADFTGQFDAVQWMNGVKQAANNDFTAINSLVAHYNFDFHGGAGPDGFGGAGHSENMSGGGGNDVLDPNQKNGGIHTLTGGSGADTFVYRAGYGAVTITDFDQGNGGAYDPTEGDQIELVDLWQPQSLTYDGTKTIADYGNGDVLTILNVNLAQVGSVSGILKAPASPGPVPGPYNVTVNPVISISQFIQISGAPIFVTSATSGDNGEGVNIGAGTNSVVLDIDAATTIQTTVTGAAGIQFNASSGNIDLANNANVTTFDSNGAVGIALGKNDVGNITLINTGNINAGSTGIAANNGASSISASSHSFIFVSNFGMINAGNNPQSTSSNLPANGIWAGYGTSGATPNVSGTVVIDDSADVTATSAAQGGASGIVAFNNSNGNVTVNVASNPDGPDTTITGYKYGIQATANNRGTAVVNGTTNGTGSASGDVTINLSQHVTVNATNAANGTYGVFAENFNNQEGNITVNMAAGDVITSKASGINVYDGATSLSSGTILVNAEGTITSGTYLNGTNGQPAGIVAGYLGTNNGVNPSNFPIVGLNGTVIINSAADINAALGDAIRGYTYGATGDVTIDATAGTIVAQGQMNTANGTSTANGSGDGISAQDNGGGNIHVTTAAGVSIKAAGSGIAANNGYNGNGNAGAVTGEITVVAYGTIESGTNGALFSGNGTSPTAGILAGYNSNGQVEANVHGNLIIDDHASITADNGDGIRGYNYGTGDVTITVEFEATVNGHRFGVAARTFDGGHISLANHGSITGGTEAVDLNSPNTPTPNGTATFDNDGYVNGSIVAYNTTFTNEAAGDWSLSGTSTFSGASTLTNDGSIESNGVSTISGLAAITNTGTIDVQSGTLTLSGEVSGTGTMWIEHGAVLEFVSGVSSDQRVNFNSDTGVLKLDDALDFHATIAGLDQPGDILRLEGFAAGDDITASTTGGYDSDTGTTTLTVIDHTQNETLTFTLQGNASAATWTVNDKGGGEFDIADPPASSADSLGSMIMHDPGQSTEQVTIGHEGSSELAAGAVASVTFDDATGHLILDDASSSQISVTGFTGDGTLAGSDQIDLKSIDYNSHTFAENYDATKGLLTITDGNKAATLQFNGTYQAANFKFISDGHGGTIVFDPPVTNDAAHNLGGNGGFDFNLPDGGHGPLQNVVHEIWDTLAPLKDVFHLVGDNVGDHGALQNIVHEGWDALAPLKVDLHLAGETNPAPFIGGSVPGGSPQPAGIGIDPVAWQDSLKLLVPHTDLHV